MAAGDSQVNAGWQAWLARNLALGVPTDELRDTLCAAGVADVAVGAEVAEVRTHPYCHACRSIALSYGWLTTLMTDPGRDAGGWRTCSRVGADRSDRVLTRRRAHRRDSADRHLTVVPAVAGPDGSVPAVAGPGGPVPAFAGPDGSVPAVGGPEDSVPVVGGPDGSVRPVTAAAGPGHQVTGAGGTADAAIRVAVVDDHPVFRLGLAALLDSLPDLGVVGAAADVEGALALVERHRPDVVVLDLHLGGGSGVAATRDILARYPGTGVLVVTMVDDEQSVCAALRAGARGYLLKSAAPAELERAVRAVANGEVLLGPEVASRAVGQLSAGRTGGPSPFPELTGREREVLDLVAQGLSNVLVARRLALSPKTVRNHLSNVLHKLQVADRSQAIRRARQAGLGRF